MDINKCIPALAILVVCIATCLFISVPRNAVRAGTPSPPSPAVGTGSRRMRVRAVAEKGVRTSGVEDARRGAGVADAPAAVRSVAGLDPATAGRYALRSRALASLGRNLAPEETDALLDYLLSPDDSMRPERVAALKNDVWNLLRGQASFPPGLVPVTAAVFRDASQPPAVRDQRRRTPRPFPLPVGVSCAIVGGTRLP